MTTNDTDRNRAKDQARAQIEHIAELIAAAKACENSDEYDYSQGDPVERIHEHPLSVQVRTGWHNPGSPSTSEWQYKILLCTGGPAVRVIGELDEWREPDTARVEYQDWGTPWTTYQHLTDAQGAALLDYASRFYFGERGR